MIKKQCLLLLCLFVSTFVFAQERSVEMADKMRANGKIYVVAAVVLTILTGIILYLVRLENKISKLEKNQL